MAEKPPPARQGDFVSASFLNYCRNGVVAEATVRKGVQDKGWHNIPLPPSEKTAFNVEATGAIPEFAIFRLKYQAGDQPLTQDTTENSPTGLYTCGPNDKFDNEVFSPYPIQVDRVYELAVDGTDPPAVGDVASVKSNTFTVQSGGNQFLCLTEPADGRATFLSLPAVGSSKLRVGFVTVSDIGPRSTGLVEIATKDDVLSGSSTTVYNPHDVTFYVANTTPGEEHPADRVLLLDLIGYSEPVIFPFMLSECEELDPLYTSEDI